MAALEQEITQPIEVPWFNESYPTLDYLVQELLINKGFTHVLKGGKGASNKTFIYTNQNTNEKRIVRIETGNTLRYNLETKKFIPNMDNISLGDEDEDEEDDDEEQELTKEQLLSAEFLSEGTNGITKNLKKFMKKIRQSSINWIRANQLEISPKLYFYGYIRSTYPKDNFVDLKQTIISEAYDSDLKKYYQTNLEERRLPSGQLDPQLTPTDLLIQGQLTELLNKISMYPLNIICLMQ